MFCWRTGVAVLAVIWSAVVLPSGAAAAFALTEQDPPFLSHVPTLKSSEYFAMFSYGPPTVPNAPHSTDWRCESRNAHRLLAAAYAKFAPPIPSRRTTVLGGRGGGRVGDLRGRVRVDGRSLAREIRHQAGDIGLGVRVGERGLAREIGHEARHVGLRVGVRRDGASATVTFTRSLAGTSRNVRPMFAPWIRFNARRVPTAAPLFWIVNGSAPETISEAAWVWAGRSPAASVAPAVARPHGVHRDLV